MSTLFRMPDVLIMSFQDSLALSSSILIVVSICENSAATSAELVRCIRH